MLNLFILTFIIVLFFCLALSIKLFKDSPDETDDSHNCSCCGMNSTCKEKSSIHLH
jgi:hypothetical protein